MQYHTDLLNRLRTKTIAVILKNPSSADEKRSDSTIRKVETYVWQHFPDVRNLRILNIFGFRATDAIEVNERIRSLSAQAVIGSENDEFFRTTLAAADYLICAWGGPSGIDRKEYSNRIASVKGLIREHFRGPAWQVCGTQVTQEPLHGLMWGYDYTLKPYEV
jgi:hypothetical protein